MRRECVYAGSWYPSDKDELDTLTDYQEEEGNARFAVLPHAGLYFSHRGIAHYFARLDKNVERIIILSPSHYYYLKPDEILTGAFTSAATPYGDIPMFPLTGCKEGGEREIAREHGVEMVLPFVKKKGNISVAMGLISQTSDPEAMASILEPQIDEHTGIIASSDFTHYGINFDHVPFGIMINNKVLEHVRDDDRSLGELLAANKAYEALNYSIDHHSTICGIAPATITCALATKRNLKGSVVDLYDSYTLSGGGDSFVSYCTVLWEDRKK
jgi:AmmeMemoRadiSam system protein B